MIKVLLVDDHDLVLTGIKSLFNNVAGISVIGVADSGEQAIVFTEQLSPDVILMDVRMPGIGGKEACRQILQMSPTVKIIALSGEADAFMQQQLLALGAVGFLSKKTSQDEMMDAIRRVMQGEHYLGKDVAENLQAQSERLKDNPFHKLSKQETKVMNLILEGKSIQEMVDEMKVAYRTVNTFRTRLYTKLGVKQSARPDVEIVRLAAQWGFQ